MTDHEVLAQLVKACDHLNKTPIVDDDFPAVKDLYWDALKEAEAHLEKADRPKVVCLCGSTRFYAEYQKANYDETMAGNIVLSVGHYPRVHKRRMLEDGCMGLEEIVVETVSHGQNVGCTPRQKEMLDALHLKKVEMADECLILNVGGYVGESTRNEIKHAERLGKTVRYLEEKGVEAVVESVVSREGR